MHLAQSSEWRESPFSRKGHKKRAGSIARPPSPVRFTNEGQQPIQPNAAGVYRMLSFCRTVAAYPQSQPEFCMATSVEFSWTLKNSVGYSS